MWYSTPSILTLLMQFGNLEAVDASSLRLVLFAGEVFPVKHLREVQRRWPAPVYYNLYGPTETNVCTFARIPADIPADRDTPYPIGFACAHCAALVLEEDGHEVASGEEGLLYISGPSVFQGYWNRPEVNRTLFLERDGRRWYNTGDLVRWDPAEGYVYLGRRDRMVKRRGYRIELGEIERALYLHPRVREAAVISTSGPGRGRADRGLSLLSRRGEPVGHRDEDVLRVAPAGLHEPGSLSLSAAAAENVDEQGGLPDAPPGERRLMPSGATIASLADAKAWRPDRRPARPGSWPDAHESPHWPGSRRAASESSGNARPASPEMK